jgi:hypothetical protein
LVGKKRKYRKKKRLQKDSENEHESSSVTVFSDIEEEVKKERSSKKAVDPDLRRSRRR